MKWIYQNKILENHLIFQNFIFHKKKISEKSMNSTKSYVRTQRFYVVHESVQKTFQNDFTCQDRNKRLLEPIIINDLIMKDWISLYSSEGQNIFIRFCIDSGSYRVQN